jgi:hypothetical protein
MEEEMKPPTIQPGGFEPADPPKPQLVPQIKDSGERITFPGGMMRDTAKGKINWLLIRSGPMMKRWAQHLTTGALKYEADNWLKAGSEEELRRAKESTARHFEQWLAGEVDEDHAAAVFFGINEVEYVKGKGTP